MKDYEEMTECVLRRSEKIIAGRNKKRKVIIRAASSAVCICLVALLGAVVFQSGIFTASVPGGGDIQFGGNQEEYERSDGSTEVWNSTLETMQSAIKVQLVVNHLDQAPIAADMDVQYSSYDYNKLPCDVWEAIKEEFYTLTGIEYDDFTARIPVELGADFSFYSLAVRGYKDSGLEDEYRLHDYVFDCKTDDGKQAIVALCTFENPLRDYFIENEAKELSDINGTQIIIYEYENTYMMQFSYKGVNYDIETRNMDLNGMEALLVSLLAE